MASGISDFIQTFLQLKQVQNQTEQIAQQARFQTVNEMNTFMELAKQTADPGQLTALVDRFAQLGVGTPEQLGSILQHVTPTVEATKGYLSKLGVDISSGRVTGTPAAEANLASETASVQNTGMNKGQAAGSSFLADIFSKVDTHGEIGRQLAEGLASRTATGMTPEQMQQGQDFLNLPQNERTQAAGVAAQTRLSAPQSAQNQLGWAGNRLGYAQLASQSAYQMGELAVENAKAQAAAKGHDPQIIDNLISAKNGAQKTLQEAAKQNAPKANIISIIGQLNSINAMLSAYGIPNEGQIPYDPEKLTNNGLFQIIKNWGQPVNVQPVNMQPAGAGRR